MSASCKAGHSKAGFFKVLRISLLIRKAHVILIELLLYEKVCGRVTLNQKFFFICEKIVRYMSS